MMWWDHGWGWGDWLGMSLTMLVLWGAVISVIVWLVATLVRNRSKQNTTPPPPRPEDLLAERFARGEIDEAEYQHRLRLLRGTPAGPPPTHLDSGAPR